MPAAERAPGAGPLAGRVALVTGGSGGIGTAVCRRLAGAGAAIVLTYRSDGARAAAVLGSLPGDGHRLLQVDVTSPADLEALRETLASSANRLDLLVNNAGITRVVPHDDLEALDDELIDSIFRTNWRGALATVRACRGLLERTPGSLVVNMSSIAGRTGVGSNIAYCASKAALDSLTMTLARALAPRVRVLSLSPGWVDGDYARAAPASYLAEQVEKTPLGRIAGPDDVAETLLALATGFPFTTGAVIPVDGGRPLN